MQLGIISEIQHDPRICMEYGNFTAYRDIVLSNIRSGVRLQFESEKRPIAYHYISVNGRAAHTDGGTELSPSASDGIAQSPATSGGSADGGDPSPAPSASQSAEGYINVIHLEGPMTRSGAACSYGSRDIRDILLAAADDSACHGHIILANTPGGMAACLPDYRMGIDAAHAAGQKVYMLIDGYSASCGAFLGAMCDGIYFTNPQDEIGSIGLYYALYTLANGAENKVSGEVYHEIFAEESFNKCRISRLAAEGNDDELRKQANSDLEQLLSDLRADRPSITEDQMHGDMFTCADVIGTLVDGQATIDSLASELMADYADRNGAPIVKATPVPAATADGGDPSPTPSAPVPGGSAAAPDSKLSTLNSKLPMTQYPTISAALNMGETIMESDADNQLTLQQSEADAIEQRLAEQNATIASLSEQLNQANQDRDAATASLSDINAQLESANAQLAAANAAREAAETALADANAAHQSAIDQLNADHQNAINAVTAERDTLQQQATEREQVIADLREQNDALNASQGAAPDAGASPAGDANPVATAPRILSPAETKALEDEQEAQR